MAGRDGFPLVWERIQEGLSAAVTHSSFLGSAEGNALDGMRYLSFTNTEPVGGRRRGEVVAGPIASETLRPEKRKDDPIDSASYFHITGMWEIARHEMPPTERTPQLAAEARRPEEFTSCPGDL